MKTRDPLVRAEIHAELRTLETEDNLDAEEQAKVEAKQVALEKISGGVLADLLAKNTEIGSVAKPAEIRQPALEASSAAAEEVEPAVQLKTLRSLETSKLQISSSATETPLIFDIPVTYNERVSAWIKYFQTTGRSSFRIYLERSARFIPLIEDALTRANLPQDLVYVAMIESGFRPDAVSHAGAMGMWQFISATGRRYGLAVDWWIDERRDFEKSTGAAIAYMKDLNQQFNSWYLVAASYNMGENGVRRLLKKHGTNDFWTLANLRALPQETTDYVPKIIAAILIAKSPALYGFRDLEYHTPMSFDVARVPGGTDLMNLAGYLGVSAKHLQELNPELIRGFIPREVRSHQIRVPKGAGLVVSQYVRLQDDTVRAAASNDLR